MKPWVPLSSLSRQILLFIVGLFVGAIVVKTYFVPTISVQRANDPNYTYINPLLTAGVSENKEFTEYKPLEAQINKVLSTTGSNVTASVYYRELTAGRWFGVNENELYSPASLMKVPIMISYFKVAENDPSALSSKIYYDNQNVIADASEHYVSPEKITKYKTYSIESLIEAMIEHSDNAATSLLFGSLDSNSFQEVATDIGLTFPTDIQSLGAKDFMTVKEYSYLFRLLYNGTYLTRPLSEKALGILTKTDFDKGLRGGVPSTIQIAHKFGERTVISEDGVTQKRELHDCGIIYYPNHPYLLCVMTKGNDFDALSQTIESISKVVYANAESRWKK